VTSVFNTGRCLKPQSLAVSSTSASHILAGASELRLFDFGKTLTHMDPYGSPDMGCPASGWSDTRPRRVLGVNELLNSGTPPAVHAARPVPLQLRQETIAPPLRLPTDILDSTVQWATSEQAANSQQGAFSPPVLPRPRPITVHHNPHANYPPPPGLLPLSSYPGAPGCK